MEEAHEHHETLDGIIGAVDCPAADEASLLEALASLHRLRAALSTWEPLLIAEARGRGVSWTRLAPALGVTSRQAAERRYLRMRPLADETLTREERIRATRDERAGDRAVTAWAEDNAAELRRLADQVTAVPGLTAAGRRRAQELRSRLAEGDPSVLLAPLADMHPHLEEHAGLSRKVGAVGRDVQRVRRTTQQQRESNR